MRTIRNDTLARFLAAEDELRANDPVVDPFAVSVPVWNTMVDRWSRAADAVIHDAALLAELRRVEPTVLDPRDRRLLAQLLLVPLDEIPPHAAAILADPRVGVTTEQVEVAAAVYLMDIEPDPDAESPYESDAVDEEEPHHDLTRMGGVPTTGPWPRPDTPFILQLDLSTLPYESDAVRAFVAATPLPPHGLLQLFHNTQGDSRTDPHLPGGGATLVYVPEATLTQRTAAVDRSSVFPVRRISMRVLPTFRFGAGADADAAVPEIIALQRRADALARRGTHSREEEYTEQTDPFAELVPSPSRLLGIQWFDVDDSAETRTILARDLPLRTPDDRHVLFLDVTGDTVLGGIFGDEGRLEIWLRASDFAATEFSNVVSFIRST